MKKSFVGVVVSTKMDKTIVVRVERKYRHTIYHKVIKRYKKFKVHCEDKNIKEGDTVHICETLPLSKTKCFTLLQLQK